jgi:hypothetical protein
MKKINLYLILRSLGVISIIGALIIFLFDGWNEMTNLYKLNVFAGFLSILFLSGEMIKYFKLDIKTSLMQILYMMGLTTFCTHIGSIIYANVYGISASLPSVLQVSPLQEGNGLILGLSAFLTLLGGVSLRRMRLPLSNIAFITSLNLLTLIPIRTGDLALILICLVALSIILFVKRVELKKQNLVLLFYPGLIMIVRGTLHMTGHAFWTFIGALVFATLFFVIPGLIKDKETQTGLQFTSVIGLLIFWFNLSGSYLLGDYAVTFIGTFLSLQALAPLCEDKGRSFQILSCFPVLLLFLKASTFDFNAYNIGATITLSLILLNSSLKYKIKYSLFSAIVFFVGVVLIAVIRAVPWSGVDTWILLASSGLIILIVSFIIEKNMEKLKMRYEHLNSNFVDWK